MFTGACKKITGNGLAAGCQLFYRKIYGNFLQCGENIADIVTYVNIDNTVNKENTADIVTGKTLRT